MNLFLADPLVGKIFACLEQEESETVNSDALTEQRLLAITRAGKIAEAYLSMGMSVEQAVKAKIFRPTLAPK